MMLVCLILALSCSLGSLAAFCINVFYYRAPRQSVGAHASHGISVLIPARNEESGIVAAVESVLASTNVEIELIVLDDASTDRTAELVAAIAARNPRVSVRSAPALPAGWNGKQHACAALARLARRQVFCFLDADVRLAPTALASLLAELEAGNADLVSGFPREETGTWLEKLLIPLIHFVLLCYCPIPLLHSLPRNPGFAAGCGQIMMVRRRAYEASGGHGAVRETMHDGLLLPRLFREKGFATDLFDLTHLARCRMYRNAGEVWRGLGKNATEGLAAPRRILPFTAMLLFGQVLPAVLVASVLLRHEAVTSYSELAWPLIALAAGYLIRCISAWRYRQSIFGAVFHPVGVLILLVLQWWSLGRKLAGRQATWKQRAYDVG